MVQAMRVAGDVVFWPLISTTYESRSGVANRQPGRASVYTERRWQCEKILAARVLCGQHGEIRNRRPNELGQRSSAQWSVGRV